MAFVQCQVQNSSSGFKMNGIGLRDLNASNAEMVSKSTPSLLESYWLSIAAPKPLAKALSLFPTVFLVPQSSSLTELKPCFVVRICVRVENELRLTWDVVRKVAHFEKLRKNLLQCGFNCKELPFFEISKENPDEYVNELNGWLQETFQQWHDISPSLHSSQQPGGAGSSECLLVNRRIEVQRITTCFELFAFDTLRRVQSAYNSNESWYRPKGECSCFVPRRLYDILEKCRQQGYETITNSRTDITLEKELSTKEKLSGLREKILNLSVRPRDASILIVEAQKKLSSYLKRVGLSSENMINGRSNNAHLEEKKQVNSEDIDHASFKITPKEVVAREVDPTRKPKSNLSISFKAQRRHSIAVQNKYKSQLKTPTLIPSLDSFGSGDSFLRKPDMSAKEAHRRNSFLRKSDMQPKKARRRSSLLRKSDIQANETRKRVESDASTFSCGINHLRFSKQPSTIEEEDFDDLIFSSDESDYDYFSDEDFTDFSDEDLVEDEGWNHHPGRSIPEQVKYSTYTFDQALGEQNAPFNSLRDQNAMFNSLRNSTDTELWKILSQNTDNTFPEHALEECKVVRPSFGRVIAYEVLPSSHVNKEDDDVLPYNYGTLALENFKPFKATVIYDRDTDIYHDRDCSSPVSIPDNPINQLDFFTEIHEQTGFMLDSVKNELEH